MASLFDPHFQSVSASGAPYSGALLYFYRAGTSTPVTIYQDADATTPHANPVVADAAGLFPSIYLLTTSPLKAILKTAAGVTIETIERIEPAGYEGASFDVQVDELSDRAAYDAEATGFSVLVSDTGDGRAAIYSKNSATSADWSSPAYISGAKGVEWKGPWQTAVAYVEQDIVEEDGASYICILAHTSGIFAADLSTDKWEVLAEKGAQGNSGVIGAWTGEWLTATAYEIDDAVEQAGSSYICVEAHTSGTFATDLTAGKWEIVAERGVAGPAGDGFFNQLEELVLTADYPVTTADAGLMLTFNKATAIAGTLPAVAASDNEVYHFLNIGAGALTIDPNASELVDGASALVLTTGAAAQIWPNAAKTAWRAFVYAPASDYLSKSQNLADLPDKVTARQNIGQAWETIYDETRSSVASIDLIDLGDYMTIRGSLFIRPSASTSISARLSDTNGASFYSGASDYINSYLYGIAGGAFYQEDGASSQIRVSSTGAVGFGGQDGLKLNFEVTRFNEGGAYAWLTYDAFAYTSTGAIAKGNGGGRCEQAVSFDAIRFFPGSGTITYADILLEGRR